MRFHRANALAVLRICAPEGTLVIRESARFDNNDSEPKSLVSLLFFLSLSYAKVFPRRKLKYFKDTYCQKHSVIFPMSE